MEIEIVSTPPGEAPEEVRKMWVGLKLPLFIEGERKFHTVGVLSGPKTWIGNLVALIFGKTTSEVGYAVNSRTAIEILECSCVEAASWWKEHTDYHSNPKRVFVFQKECCQVAATNS